MYFYNAPGHKLRFFKNWNAQFVTWTGITLFKLQDGQVLNLPILYNNYGA